MNYDQFYAEYFPFWNKLSEADKEFLCQNSSLVHFEKEQAVHNNTGCSGLYIVKSENSSSKKHPSPVSAHTKEGYFHRFNRHGNSRRKTANDQFRSFFRFVRASPMLGDRNTRSTPAHAPPMAKPVNKETPNSHGR